MDPAPFGSGEKNHFCWHFETKFVLLISYYWYININKDNLLLRSHKTVEIMDYPNFFYLLMEGSFGFRSRSNIPNACVTHESGTLFKKNVILSRRGEGREGEREGREGEGGR